MHFGSLRSKATIEEGIIYREQLEDGREVVEYCPGDGSRYHFIISPLKGFSDETLKKTGLSTEWENVVVTLANDPGAVRSVLTHRGAFIAYDWLQPKLGVSIASAIVIAEFLGWLLGGQAWSCAEAREHFSDE